MEGGGGLSVGLAKPMAAQAAIHPGAAPPPVTQPARAQALIQAK